MKGVHEEDLTKEHTHFAFEWPRWSSGWNLNILTNMYRILKCEGKLDGCRYGHDHFGDLVRGA
eukprot:15675735-Heterocapsa_arctica.AAC.1